MNYQTHNEHKSLECYGHLIGNIDITYAELIALFGLPLKEEYDDYKSDAEWHIIFDNRDMLIIYNYKDGKSYNGKSGLNVEEITDWHIGGQDEALVTVLEDIIRTKQKPSTSL